jgi:hypothetical protein
VTKADADAATGSPLAAALARLRAAALAHASDTRALRSASKTCLAQNAVLANLCCAGVVLPHGGVTTVLATAAPAAFEGAFEGALDGVSAGAAPAAAAVSAAPPGDATPAALPAVSSSTASSCAALPAAATPQAGARGTARPQWQYRVVAKKPVSVRATGELRGDRTEHSCEPNSVVLVASRIVVRAQADRSAATSFSPLGKGGARRGGVAMLRLANGTGWVPDRAPNGTVLLVETAWKARGSAAAAIPFGTQKKQKMEFKSTAAAVSAPGSALASAPRSGRASRTPRGAAARMRSAARSAGAFKLSTASSRRKKGSGRVLG